MSKRSLLLADDSITIQKVINLTFSDEGFEVRTFGDGDSAMDGIREAMPDVVLVDVNMPGQDGYGICETLRQNDLTRHVPVILLVGSFEPFDRERAEKVGANAYQTKPFQSIRQLVEQVKELVASVPSANGHGETEQVPEAEPAQLPDDIDSLYTLSFGETAVDERQRASGFDDSGLDDEMIETSYLGGADNGDTLDFEIATTDETEQAAEPETEPSINDYYQQQAEQPYHAEETPTAETGFQVVEETVDPYGTVELQMPTAREAETVSYDEELLSLSPEAETTEFRTSFEVPVPAESQAEPETPSQMGIETVSFDAPTLQTRQFEEVDLLDLPPIGSNETVELTTAERAEIMGSDKQVVSVSPELMEIIVEKVVERLSQKY